MQTRETLTTLAEELLRIADIPKCQGCSCYLDVLDQFRQATTSHPLAGHPTDQIGNLVVNFQVTHGCLGCDPCYPVPIANALSELCEQIRSLAPTCRAEPICSSEARPWPPEPGEYVLGTKSAPIAISTLASRTLPAALSQELDTEHFALIGITETENIGVEKVAKNIVSNPNIRFLILCGQESHGHFSGQTLLSLHKEGLDKKHRVIGSLAKNPFLKNLTGNQVQLLQRQVQLVDMVGCQEVPLIVEAVQLCLAENRGPFRDTVSLSSTLRILARSPASFIRDKSGFFIIILDRRAGKVLLEHYENDGTRTLVIEGRDASSLYSTAIRRRLISRLDHAAYLGKELARAELALELGLEYEQDAAPGKENKR